MIHVQIGEVRSEHSILIQISQIRQIIAKYRNQTKTEIKDVI